MKARQRQTSSYGLQLDRQNFETTLGFVNATKAPKAEKSVSIWENLGKARFTTSVYYYSEVIDDHGSYMAVVQLLLDTLLHCYVVKCARLLLS